MARQKQSHLTMRGGVFWLRFALPPDLRKRLQRREWRFSLRTREPSLAKVRCLETTLAVERLHTLIRSMSTLTDAQITDIAKAYLEWALKHAVDGGKTMAAGPYSATVNDEVFEPRSFQQLDDGCPENERKALAEVLNRKRADLVGHKQGWSAKHLAAEFSTPLGIDFNGLDASSQTAVLHALQRAEVEEYRIRLAQMEGNYAETIARDPLFDGMTPPLRVDWCATPKARTEIPTLATGVKRFCDSRAKGDDWVRKTAVDYQRVLSWFVELNGGDTPITDITQQAVREFCAALDDLPANAIKSKDLQGKPLPELLRIARSRKGDATLSQATKAKYFTKLKAFLTWCEEQGYAPSPVGKIKVKEPRNAKEQRLPFSTEQLQKLLNSPQYTGHMSPARRAKLGQMVVRDGKFWIPLVGLYSGMRMGEIVQLLVKDVREIDGVLCFDVSLDEEITKGPEKRLKTQASVRRIPVHPKLIEFGFGNYLNAQRKAKMERLFPDIAPGRDGYYSHNFSKYFARYLVHIGIKTKKTTFHSLRHNFAQGCDSAGVSLLIREALMGHADDSTAARYGDIYTPEELANNIAKISFKTDLSHLVCTQTK